VLVGTGPGFRKDEAREGWNQVCERYATIFQTKGFDGLGKSAELDGSVHRNVEGLIHAARGILRQRDAGVIDSLPTIGVPTLIVVGENDKPFLAGSEYMAKKIPGARHVVIAGAPANAPAARRRPRAAVAGASRTARTAVRRGCDDHAGRGRGRARGRRGSHRRAGGPLTCESLA
jgi:hypothetical protein